MRTLPFCLLFFIVGCQKTELSEVRFEQGNVVNVNYIPSKSYTTFDYVPDFFDGGKFKLQMVNRTKPEQHWVTLDWKWGQMEFDNAELWKKLEKGQSIIISYQDVYSVDKNGVKTWQDRIFIDAKPNLKAEAP